MRDNWAKIADEAGQKAYFAGGEQSQKFFRKMSGGLIGPALISGATVRGPPARLWRPRRRSRICLRP